jgi:F-type H+-transporting ATPase subunit b
MDATLNELGALLLRAIPTVILLILLHLYLKIVFFKPLQAVLEKRREATEGAREAAQNSLKKADEKTAEFETKLQQARAEIYKEQEDTRKRWLADQTKHAEEARQKNHAQLQTVKKQLTDDIDTAKKQLATYSETLADHITHTLLERKAG